ncbi:MAG TPA: hypothetical protein VNJ54_07935 [Plantibacter sp.]|uniref:hypothetical protein n=1 Tax=Plantibacter sp. TaxID=1871045 RepID=UPI002C294641|nr:hypothetical protein [Plantibacter sp.]
MSQKKKHNRPPGAPKPQDHQGKKPVVREVEGGKEVTLGDITVTVRDAALDDFELLDDLHELDVNKKGSRLPSLMKRLVGDDYQPILEKLRDKHTGRVRVEHASEFIRDLLGALNPN